MSQQVLRFNLLWTRVITYRLSPSPWAGPALLSSAPGPTCFWANTVSQSCLAAVSTCSLSHCSRPFGGFSTATAYSFCSPGQKDRVRLCLAVLLLVWRLSKLTKLNVTMRRCWAALLGWSSVVCLKLFSLPGEFREQVNKMLTACLVNCDYTEVINQAPC